MFEITGDPMIELSYLNSADVMKTVEKPLAAGGVWEFPAASVSAVEVTVMGRVGLPELLVILILLVTWLLPVAAGVWAVVTLNRVRIGQDVVRAKLESIERLLQRG